MYRVSVFLALALSLALSSIGAAQERGSASAIEWSPDGETIAIASSTGVWFFDNDFNELGYVQVQQGKWNYSPRSLGWNANSDLVAIAYPTIADSELPMQIIDVTRLKVTVEIETLGLWTQIAWHPARNLIAGGAWGGTTSVWDALTGEQVFNFEESADRHGWSNSTTLAVCWTTDSEIVIVTEWETYIVNVDSNEILERFDIYTLGHHRAACHRDYRIRGGAVEIIDLRTGERNYFVSNDAVEPIEVLVPQDAEYVEHDLDIEFSPDASKFASIGEGCHLAIYDGHRFRLLARIRSGILIVEGPFAIPYLDALAWHPDGSRFAAVGQFGGVRVWDAQTYELLQIYDGFEADYGELSPYIEILKSRQYADMPDASEIEALKERCKDELDSAALDLDGN